MSAQDTTGRPQALSTSHLILSITSNPLTELLFGPANFSLVKLGVESRRMEPSQPCIQQHIFYTSISKNSSVNRFLEFINMHEWLIYIFIYAYINEAVMKMQTQQRGPHAPLLLHGLLHNSFDGWQSLWAYFVVKSRV